MNAELLGYKEVAALFDLPEARLRYWAQTGICGPSVRQRGKFLYTFPDLVGVKVAKELTSTGLPLQKVRKNLDALRQQLPQIDRPLSQLRVCSDGNELFVLSEDRVLQPASGQVVMSFAIRALDQRLADVRPLRAVSAEEPPPEPEAAPPDELPTSPYAAFLAGLEAEEAGEIDRAETLLRHALRLDPHLSAAWTNLGNLRLAAGARGEAREAYERALALDPDSPQALQQRGLVRFRSKELAEAERDFTRSLELDRFSAVTWMNRGAVRHALGRSQEGLPDLEQALLLDPRLPGAFANRGLIWKALGDTGRALADLTRAVELDPKDPSHLRNRALAHEQAKDLAAAEADLSEALRLQPDHADTLQSRAQIRIERGDLDGATADVDRLVEVDPSRHLVARVLRKAIETRRSQ